MAKSKNTDSELPNPVIPPEPPKHITPKPRKTERQLRVKFTDAELLEKGRVAGEKYAERARIEADFDSVKAQFKEKLSRVDSEIGEVSEHLRAGFEYRKVPCEITFDSPDQGKKTTRRLDTNEVVDTEAMTIDEMQSELDLKATTKGIDSEGVVRVAGDEGGEGGTPDEGDEK